MSEHFRTGDAVLTSAVYDVIDEDGAVLQQLPLAQGDHFPPYQGLPRLFFLRRKVAAKYTSVASAAVIDEIASDFSAALKRLAKK
jgi:hypothetical protein